MLKKSRLVNSSNRTKNWTILTLFLLFVSALLPSCSIFDPFTDFFVFNAAKLSSTFTYNGQKEIFGNKKFGWVTNCFVYPSAAGSRWNSYFRVYLDTVDVKLVVPNYKSVLNNNDLWEIDNYNLTKKSLDLSRLLALGVIKKVNIKFGQGSFIYFRNATEFAADPEYWKDTVYVYFSENKNRASINFDKKFDSALSNTDFFKTPRWKMTIETDPRDITNAHPMNVQIDMNNFCSLFRLSFDQTVSVNSLTIIPSATNSFRIRTHWKTSQTLAHAGDNEFLTDTSKSQTGKDHNNNSYGGPGVFTQFLDYYPLDITTFT
jgi:hypothetical protein